MTQPETDYVIGQRVFYVLPRAPKQGRHRMTLWSGTVHKVGLHRITVALDGHSRLRSMARWSLTITTHPGMPVRGRGL